MVEALDAFKRAKAELKARIPHEDCNNIWLFDQIHTPLPLEEFFALQDSRNRVCKLLDKLSSYCYILEDMMTKPASQIFKDASAYVN